MRITALDWAIVALSIAISFLPALLLAKRAGRSTEEFFTSGRAAPWWLVGVSMVATTFSTDTPNLVTDFVRTAGVAKNWSWWISRPIENSKERWTDIVARSRFMQRQFHGPWDSGRALS